MQALAQALAVTRTLHPQLETLLYSEPQSPNPQDHALGMLTRQVESWIVSEARVAWRVGGLSK